MKKILIIDDEPDIRKAAVFRIKKAGFEVFEAKDGQEGLEKAEEIKPDLILLDWKLPVMDGKETFIKLKEAEGLKDIPVIIFTASRDEETFREKAKEIGIKHIIIKPYEPSVLIDKIKELTG